METQTEYVTEAPPPEDNFVPAVDSAPPEPVDSTLEYLVTKVGQMSVELYELRRANGDLRDRLAEAQLAASRNLQHVYHHNDSTPTIHVKKEVNSLGTNWECSVLQAGSVDDVLATFAKVSASFKRANGLEEPTEKPGSP